MGCPPLIREPLVAVRNLPRNPPRPAQNEDPLPQSIPSMDRSASTHKYYALLEQQLQEDCAASFYEETSFTSATVTTSMTSESTHATTSLDEGSRPRRSRRRPRGMRRAKLSSDDALEEVELGFRTVLRSIQGAAGCIQVDDHDLGVARSDEPLMLVDILSI